MIYQSFSQDSYFILYGQLVHQSPQSVKISFQINNWPFLSSSNTLEVAVALGSPDRAIQSLSTVPDVNAVDVVLNVGSGVSLVAVFPTWYATDGVATNSTPTIDTDSLTVTYKLPYFSVYGYVDPSMTVLVGGNSGSGGGGVSPALIGGVVGGVLGGAAIIFLVLFILFKKKKLRCFFMHNSGEKDGL